MTSFADAVLNASSPPPPGGGRAPPSSSSCPSLHARAARVYIERVTPPSLDPVRLDRWLWASRAFRSRTLAADACDGGKVEVNGARAKPHKSLRPGDLVVITTRDGRRTLKVAATAERRGPASEARTLYEDLTPPKPKAEAPLAPRERGAGRPTKRERRRLDRWSSFDPHSLEP